MMDSRETISTLLPLVMGIPFWLTAFHSSPSTFTYPLAPAGISAMTTPMRPIKASALLKRASPAVRKCRTNHGRTNQMLNTEDSAQSKI